MLCFDESTSSNLEQFHIFFYNFFGYIEIAVNKMKISQGLKWAVSSQPLLMAAVVSFTLAKKLQVRFLSVLERQQLLCLLENILLENLFQKYFIIKELPFSSLSLIAFINYIKSNFTR